MGILPTNINPKDEDRIRRFGARRPGTTFPDGPVEGDTFWKTDSKDYWIWDGSNWREITIAVLQAGNIVTVKSYQVAAGSGNTASGAWVDYPGPHDITIVKKYDGAQSKLVVFGAVGAFASTNGTLMDIGLSFGGVDHIIGSFFFNFAGTHLNASCQDDTFAALAAGTQTGRLRWRAGSQINTDGNDNVRLTVLEVII